MKKLYFFIWGKYRKVEKTKISYLLEKTPILSNSSIEDEKLFKREKIIEILKILGWIENM